MAQTNATTIEHLGRVTTHRPVATRRRRFQGESDNAMTLSGEGGYAMALTALLIIPIMIFLALSVDLGAWYAQGSREQRAADAAAMAGVVWLPDPGKAATEATRVAQANGFTSGVLPSTVANNPSQYQVTITQQAPRFFSSVFQSGNFSMTRSAIAAFNKPIPMGSPTNKMGNDIDPALCPGFQPASAAPCGPQPLLWAAVNGPFDNYENGDLYSTRCPGPGGSSGTSCDDSSVNPYYRSTGYEFAVDVGATDVGVPLTISTYVLGAWSRNVGTDKQNERGSKVVDVGITNGSPTITFTGTSITASDVCRRVFNATIAGIPMNAVIASVDTINHTAVLNTACNSTVTGGVTIFTGPNGTPRNAISTGPRTIQIGYDCNTNATTPWNAAIYSGMAGGNCQSGDDSDYGQNMDVQLYDNDGSDLTVTVTTPLACHLSVSATSQWTQAGAAAYKNNWATVCTFTPTKPGIYPLFVRNSGFATTPGQGGFSPADTGVGTNAYALKITGGAASRMYSLDDMSIFTNAPGSTSRFYLAEIKPEHKGKTLNIDLYDPGDGGGSGQYTMQVQAPAAGSPAVVPSTGTTIPAAGFATSCQYNPTKSLTKGGGTLSTAPNCSVVTHDSSLSPSNIYNGNWLRVQVKIDPNYTCNTPAVPDCWWTIKYTFGSGGLPTDRTVWSISVVGDPVHLVG